MHPIYRQRKTTRRAGVFNQLRTVDRVVIPDPFCKNVKHTA
jgi:hypothetical protein